MNKPDDLLNKRIPVPVVTYRRFPEPEQQIYTYISKNGKRELKPSVAKKIKWRLEHEDEVKEP